jgi:uncharacterized protein (DUF433 family)
VYHTVLRRTTLAYNPGERRLTVAKLATSIRIEADMKEELERRARDAGVTPAVLYERFIGEGLRHDSHPLIVFRDGAAGRRPVLVGSRLTVAQVIETLLASDGRSIEDAAEFLELPPSHVRECVRYYADYRDEVDAWRERSAETAERERAAWQREQAVLA